MNLKVKKMIPTFIIKKYERYESEKIKNMVLGLPKISESDFEKILLNEIGLVKNDNVFVHSSLGMLNLSFPSYEALKIILNVIGGDGTFACPTYPKISSYKFLTSGEIFNVKKTPTYTGILNEFARRHKNAVRSLHPTKSVVAIGPLATAITSGHNLSPYPYDYNSPYYKINEYGFKVVGLGVQSTYLSAVHAVDDTIRERYPVDPYNKNLFEAKCIDYDGNQIIVPTYAHDLYKMKFDLPNFFKQNVPKSICSDINISGMNFFKANSKELYDYLCKLADNGITIYKKKYYKK